MRQRRSLLLLAVPLAVTLAAASGCGSSFKKIDRRVDSLLQQSTRTLGHDAVTPASIKLSMGDDKSDQSYFSNRTVEQPETINPSAGELPFVITDEADDVLERLNSYNRVDGESLPIDLQYALSYATGNSREYKFAQEEYIIAALELLIERHLWGPRFFDEVSALVTGSGNDGLYDTSLQLVNEFRVTQRLPYGGEVSARALARATEDLHQRVAGENVQTADIILNANIPLLRGAGLTAREDRIQAERNLIYAARDFERFRRDLVFGISEDFLDLVVQQKAVANAERQVAQLQEVEARERTLYEAGRSPRFQAALAEQATVSALDDLNSRKESYRLAVDRFKLRLNMPVDRAVEILPSTLELPVPQTDLSQAVRLGLTYRLDLQTQRDRVDDTRRRLDNARNDLEPDLNLTGSVNVPTDSDRDRAGLRFSPDDSTFTAGVTLGLPLDRDIERLTVRQAQIAVEREGREYDLLRDEIAVNVRAAVRDIDRARYTLAIQERNIAIGEQRKASIEAAPDRATARDASEAANELLVAEDRRDEARRDLQVAILRYLLETGQLRVDPQGLLQPLPGMMEAPIVTDEHG